MNRFVGSLAAATLAGSLIVLPANACMFHTSLPELTITDELRRADAMVLARDNAKYEFEAVEALRGGLDYFQVPFLADTTTVRRLTLNPDDAVLFAHDPDIGEWKRLAYVDEEMRGVLTALLAEIDRWPLEYNEDRFAFFADLHDHPDTSIRQMAHVELDSAPYALLRNLDLRLDPRLILASLRVFSAYKWLPFNYLLLGISGDDVARKELNRAVSAADKYTAVASLGPAATALIEIDGLDGLARLEALFLDDPGEPLDRLEKVVQALVIHNQVGTAELRARIGDALSRLVRSRPETGPIVARSLADSNDWSQTDAMERLLESRQLGNFPEMVVVATYLERAKQAQAIE